MITLYAFGTIFPEGIGETKDLRAQWVLEETGLPYRVHALDHSGGECDGEAYKRISPFQQVPVIDDDGFVVAESAAIALYLAEKSGKLIPKDFQGRARVTQWCIAAVGTVETTFASLDLVGIFDGEKLAPKVHEGVDGIANRWLERLESRLKEREWIACADFTVADLMMAGVLRHLRTNGMMDPYPKIKAYYEKCFARPAWQRTLEMYAKRLGTTVEKIR